MATLSKAHTLHVSVEERNFVNAFINKDNGSRTYDNTINKNLAIANRSHVSCAHNTSTAYRPNYTVASKSRLRVTHGTCKRNHWIDHTRLSSSRVI